jgi:hypothetical protein
MDSNDLAEHLRERGADATLVGMEHGTTDLIVAEMLRQGWRISDEENVNGVRIRYLVPPR